MRDKDDGVMTPDEEETLAFFLDVALSQLEKGKFERALDGFNMVLAITPDDRDALCGRGIALIGLKNTEAAMADIRRAASLGSRAAIQFLSIQENGSRRKWRLKWWHWLVLGLLLWSIVKIGEGVGRSLALKRYGVDNNSRSLPKEPPPLPPGFQKK